MSRKRCYFGCNDKAILHRFPKPEENPNKFLQWKQVLDTDMQAKGDKYIFNNIRICHRHFISCLFQLPRHAVPTLHLSPQENQNTNYIDNIAMNENPLVREPVFDVSNDPQENQNTNYIDNIARNENPLVREPVFDVSDDPQENQNTNYIDNIARNENSLMREPVFDASDEHLQNRVCQPGSSKSRYWQNKDHKNNSHCIQQTVKIRSASERFYENEIKKLMKKVTNLTNKYKKTATKLKIANKLLEKGSLKIIENLPPTTRNFLNMQFQFKKKPRGRRFTLDEKILALTISKQSQKAYNLCRKLFVLPSKRTLQKLLSSFNLTPGINSQIFKNLKATMKKLPTEKRLCTLIWDEVALAPGLYYNHFTKEIVGFSDYGSNRFIQIADHALVFMIKSIKCKSKQPISFSFCQGATESSDLKNMIISIISDLSKAGVIIVATICDQASANVSTINSFKADTLINYQSNNKILGNEILINDLQIFPLYDPPHLLKGIRNNLITKNLKFIHNGIEKVAKWDHLKLLYEADSDDDELRFLKKLTDSHIEINKMNKMKVALAAQVFSDRVSCAMRFCSNKKIIPSECRDTADLLLIFDKLFDSFNGHNYQGTAKALQGCLKHNSPHFEFWNEILPVLESMKFESRQSNRDGTVSSKFVKVPSIINWVHNIKTMIDLWKYLNEKYKINNILTRNFNQDPLENFFCSVRSNGIRNTNPTCQQFINSFKTLLINNFNSSHSINANCESDNNKSIQSLKSLLKPDLNKLPDSVDFACQIDSLLIALDEIKSSNMIMHVETKKYVAGFIIKKCKTKICKNCSICQKDLMRPEKDLNSLTYEVDYTKKSLFHANEAFINLLNEIYYMIITCLKDAPEMKNLTSKMIFFINCRCNFNAIITCQKHKSDLIDFIINLSIKLIVHSWCTSINRILSGNLTRFDQNDKIKSNALDYYNKHKKKRTPQTSN